MTLNAFQRDKIVEALLNYRKNQFDGTDTQFAKIFDINASAFNRLKKGERERIIKDDRLVTIGRKLNVHWRDAAPWKIVETEVYQYICQQLKYCKDNSIARIYCDLADVGKTTAAKEFMLKEKNVIYLDCSKLKTKTTFVRALARAVGVNDKGAIAGVIADTIYMIQCMERPLIILDEAGDLHYEAWLEIKAYWNALEGYCGWYMMGADGLRKKIENNVRNEKVGYAEIFRRFGSEFMAVANKKDRVTKKAWYYSQAEIIAHANLPKGYNFSEFVKARRIDSLTRLKEDIQKELKPNLLPLQVAEV